MNTENFLSALDIRIADCYLTVETTGAEKGGVKNIGAVCCRHNDDSVVRAETVHLNEELVQGLLSFVVTAAETSASVTTDSVDFIYEYNACGSALCRFKKVADS